MEILRYLNSTDIITDFEILDYKKFENGFFIKVRCNLIDNTELFIREYFDPVERNYSYHWQKRNSELIIRWDNSPHQNELTTFPHHKHIGKKVETSYEITIEEVLKYIGSKIEKNT